MPSFLLIPTHSWVRTFVVYSSVFGFLSVPVTTWLHSGCSNSDPAWWYWIRNRNHCLSDEQCDGLEIVAKYARAECPSVVFKLHLRCLYVFPWCSGSLAKGGFVIKPSETRCAELPFHWDALMLQQPSFQISWVCAGLTMSDTGDTLSYFSGYKTAKQSVRIQWNVAIVSSDCWKNACRGRAFLMLQV